MNTGGFLGMQGMHSLQSASPLTNITYLTRKQKSIELLICFLLQTKELFSVPDPLIFAITLVNFMNWPLAMNQIEGLVQYRCGAEAGPLLTSSFNFCYFMMSFFGCPAKYPFYV